MTAIWRRELLTTTMAAGRNISYVKPSEPSFIRRMKEQVGFKEGPTVDTKREQLPKDDGGDNDGDRKDDEAPQVVVLRAGDLTREEADELLDRLDDSTDGSPCHGQEQEYATVENQEVGSDSEDATAALGGKIAFRKPTKRQSSAVGDDNGGKDDDDQEELFGLNASSNSKRRRKDSRARKNSSSEMQQVNNRSLLSFDDDEHDDDDG